MPTDAERREAACKVRSASDQSPRMWQQIRGMLGMPKDCGIPQIREYLASLIEPEPERTCRMVRDNLTDTTYCDVCGERFDQPWYLGAKPHGVDTLVYHVEYRDARYCPHCGARVVDE